MKFVENSLWVEKYRPKTIDEYVWSSEKQRKIIEKILKEKSLPHILLAGDPGTGKTSLAKVLFRELDVQPQDVLEINGSVDNSIDVIRNNITMFASTLSIGGMRYILIDEADYLSKNTMAGLRNLMENFSTNCRFILTCNYPNKIIPALKSRCQTFIVKTPDKKQMLERIFFILENENIEYDKNIVLEYVSKFFPDFRKIINSIQQNSFEGKLHPIGTEESDNPSWYRDVLLLFSHGYIYQAREIIVNNIDKEDYEDFYKFLYDTFVNNLFENDLESQMDAVIIIQKYLVDHTMCADPEINLSACLVRLQEIVNRNPNIIKDKLNNIAIDQENTVNNTDEDTNDENEKILKNNKTKTSLLIDNKEATNDEESINKKLEEIAKSSEYLNKKNNKKSNQIQEKLKEKIKNRKE